MPKRVEYHTVIPWGHQQKALLLLEHNDIDFVHMDGGRGSGKSTPINAFCMQEAFRYKGNRGLFFRRKQDDASTADVTLFLEQTPKPLIYSVRNEGQRKIVDIIPRNWSGEISELSQIMFAGVISEGKQNPDNAKGEFGFIACPELDQIEENVFLQACTSLRKANAGRKCLTACNRVERYHWIRKYFPMNAELLMDGEDFWICQNKECGDYGLLVNSDHACETAHRVVYAGGFKGYASIWSKTSDNKSLPTDYVEKTFGNKPAAWVAKYIDGKSGFEPDGRGVFEQSWRADLCVHDFPIHDTYVLRAYDPDLNPAVTWSQLVEIDGVNHYFLIASIAGFNCKYSDFLIEAWALQNEIFGSGMSYKECGDPKLKAESGQSKESYLHILAGHGVKNVQMRTDLIGNSKSYRVQIVEEWLTPMGNGTSRFHVHPRNDIAIEGFDGGYKYRWVQTLKKLVQEPIKDETYSGVQDCIQYTLTNFADIQGGVRQLAPSRGSRMVAEVPASTAALPQPRRSMSRIVRG